MATIGIDTVPTNTRLPGAYFGFDTRTGVRSSGIAPQNMVAVGLMDSGGSAETNKVYDIVEEGDAVTLFGEESALHTAVRAAMRQYSFGRYCAIACASDGAADIKTALDVLKRSTYNIIAFDFLTADAVGALKEHIDTVTDAINQQGVIAVLAKQSQTRDEIKALAQSVNHNRFVLVGYKNIDGVSQAEVSAALAALILSQPDPALGFDGDVLNGINEIAPDDNWTRNEQEYLLSNGVTPLQRLSGAQTAVVRLISTQTDGASKQAPDLWIRTLDYVRERMIAVFKENFAKTKLTNRVPAAVRSVFLGEAKALEAASIVKNVDLWKDKLTVVKSQENSGFLNARIPADCVLGLHGVIGHVELRLS